ASGLACDRPASSAPPTENTTNCACATSNVHGDIIKRHDAHTNFSLDSVSIHHHHPDLPLAQIPDSRTSINQRSGDVTAGYLSVIITYTRVCQTKNYTRRCLVALLFASSFTVINIFMIGTML
ncbi:ATP-sensitive inward rectifier potassium channel 1, partial [Clarias magur]